jgi:hypothetical protein
VKNKKDNHLFVRRTHGFKKVTNCIVDKMEMLFWYLRASVRENINAMHNNSCVNTLSFHSSDSVNYYNKI